MSPTGCSNPAKPSTRLCMGLDSDNSIYGAGAPASPWPTREPPCPQRGHVQHAAGKGPLVVEPQHEVQQALAAHADLAAIDTMMLWHSMNQNLLFADSERQN